MTEVTRILDRIERGDPHAASQLLPLVYDKLRRLATHELALQEQPGQTLQATALVHEAYLRLVGQGPDQHWEHRGHFFAAAAAAMGRILVERARRKRSRKHGGGLSHQVSNLDDLTGPDNRDPLEALAVHEALDQLLGRRDPARNSQAAIPAGRSTRESLAKIGALTQRQLALALALREIVEDFFDVARDARNQHSGGCLRNRKQRAQLAFNATTHVPCLE